MVVDLLDLLGKTLSAKNLKKFEPNCSEWIFRTFLEWTFYLVVPYIVPFLLFW